MQKVTVAITMMALLCLGANALANTQTTLVMTGVVTAYGDCAIPDPCPNAVVNMNVGDGIAAYLVLRNYEGVAGVQTAFDWGNWTYTFGLWDCQVNQITGTAPTAPGGTTGTIATVFDCVSGGASAVIGRLHFLSITEGCITQVLSTFPFGNHVIDCAGGVQEIDPACWGSICAGTGSVGVDVCGPCEGSTPVEPATWGSIKAQYN